MVKNLSSEAKMSSDTECLLDDTTLNEIKCSFCILIEIPEIK